MTLPIQRVATLAAFAIAMMGPAAAQGDPEDPPEAGAGDSDKGAANSKSSVAFAVLLQLGGTPEKAQKVAETLAERAEKFICRSTVTVPMATVPKNCATSPECVKKHGQEANSKRLALITSMTSGAVVRLDIQLFAADNGRRIERRQVQYKTEPEAAFGEAAQTILAQLFPDGGEECTAKAPEQKPAESVPEVPDPAEAAALAADTATDTAPNGASALGKPWRNDRSSKRKWIWIGGAAVAVAAAATAIYFATAQEELPQLVLPPAP